MMLNKKTKVKVHKPDGYSDVFDIVAVHNLPRLRTSNVDRSNDRKRLSTKKKNKKKKKKKKARGRRYPTHTITDTDSADDIALLANTPSQTESL